MVGMSSPMKPDMKAGGASPAAGGEAGALPREEGFERAAEADFMGCDLNSR